MLDGLGWEQLASTARHCPRWRRWTAGPITTVAPSTTATALTSITTGLTPGEHGLVGYRMDVGGEVLNVLRWCDRRRRRPAPATSRSDVQPFAPFLGEPVPVVSQGRASSASAFTEAHLRGGGPSAGGPRRASPSTVGELLRAGERVRLRLLRRHRQDRPRARLRAVLRRRAALPPIGSSRDVLDASCPTGAALLVTADHGQVDVGDRHRRRPHADVLATDASPVGRGPLPLAARPPGRRRRPARRGRGSTTATSAWVHEPAAS